MKRSILVGGIGFLTGATMLALAQTTGLRPEPFIALSWIWSTPLNVPNIISSVNNNANLRALTPGQYSAIVRLGFTVLYDAPPLVYFWNNICPGSPDNGAFVAPTISSSGCWVADFPSSGLDVREWGADATGVTDATTAVQACVNAAGEGNTCYINPAATLKVLGSVAVPAWTTLNCGLTFPASGSPNAAAFNTLPALRLHGSHTINLVGQGASVHNCLILRNGIVTPVIDSSAFTGTAITSNGNSDVSVVDSIILGFDTCINVFGSSRVYLDHDIVDCTGVTNAAIYGGNSTDIGHYLNLRLESSAGGSGGSPAGCATTRPGTGIKLVNDAAEYLDNVLVEFYQIADVALVSGAVAQEHMIGKLWTDFTSNIGCARGSSIGLQITGSPLNSLSFVTADQLVLQGSQNGLVINGIANTSTTTLSNVYCGSIGNDCIQLGNAGTTSGKTKIGSLVINTAAGYAIDVLDSTGGTWFDLGGGYLNQVHGAVAPYISFPTTYSKSHVSISDTLKTDLALPSSLYGTAIITGCTGVGSGSCSILGTSYPNTLKGMLLLAPAGSPSNGGSVSLTFPIAFDNYESCVATLRDGSGTWNSPTVRTGSTSAFTVFFQWSNNGALAAGATYGIAYNCAMQ
jgi:hypothetical protein